jgi:Transglycosylase SLT domain
MPLARLRHVILALALAVAFAAPNPGLTRGDPAALCQDAAARAAADTGVPLDVLLTIATVETGRNDRPWPWTVNFGGEGRWFDSAAEAAASVDEALRTGATNIDLGCFQLNYRWHAEAFGSIDDMLDPARNAVYAAEYLSKHYAETGDWALAAAAYHSSSPENARIYQDKFETTYARLSSEPLSEAPVADYIPADAPRHNSFPLLVAGSQGLNGSLFSASSGGRPLIGAP